MRNSQFLEQRTDVVRVIVNEAKNGVSVVFSDVFGINGRVISAVIILNLRFIGLFITWHHSIVLMA